MIFTMEETSQLTEYPMGYLRLITYVLENCIHCIESNSKRVSFYRKKKKREKQRFAESIEPVWISRAAIMKTTRG